MPGIGGDRKGRLGRREAGDGHAVGRAGDVVKPDLLAEGDRSRVAAMLAANAELDVRTGRPAALRCDAHQLAHAFGIQRDEGILRDELLRHVVVHEIGRVVPADAIGRLGQVIGTKGEKLSRFGDLPGMSAARGSSIMVPIW